MRMARPGVLAVLLAASGWSAAAPFSLETQRRGDAIEIVAVADIRAEPARVWTVLTSYEHYAQFIPDMTLSRVVQREGGVAVVELEGAARVLWWREPVAVRLAVTETPPWRVHAALISGTIQAMEGHYEIESAPGGVRLTYTGHIVPDGRQRGLLDRIIVRLNVSRQFGALVAEIERKPP